MSATTPFLNLYKPGGGSTGLIVPDEVVDVDRFNANSDLIDTWAQTTDTFRLAQLGRNQQYRGLTANIGAITSPVKGDTYQETDALFRKWEYDGSNWLTAEVGMYLIRPSAVSGTGVVINADGSVLPGTSTFAQLDGIFTSRFKRYKIFAEWSGSSGGAATMQFCVAGAVDSAASYSNQVLQGVSASATASIAGPVTNFPVTFVAGFEHDLELSVTNPANAARFTKYRSQIADLNSGQSAGVGAGFYSTNKAHDGIRLTLAAGNFANGEIRVYGLV